MTRITPTIHYILHAILGGCLGFFASVIFWLLAIFQQFDRPVDASIRLRSAFYMTIFIMMAIFLIFFGKKILAKIRELSEEDELEQKFV